MRRLEGGLEHEVGPLRRLVGIETPVKFSI